MILILSLRASKLKQSPLLHLLRLNKSNNLLGFFLFLFFVFQVTEIYLPPGFDVCASANGSLSSNRNYLLLLLSPLSFIHLNSTVFSV